MTLQGQIAVVTGASRGIGRAIALTLGRTGAFVIGTATAEAGLNNIDKLLKEHDIYGQSSQLNASDVNSVAAFGESLREAGHHVSILVNNAGITRDNLLMRMSEVDWQQVIDVNLGSVYRLSKLMVRDMIKARHGRIINITSVVGLAGNAGQANYAAAKAGIIGFTKSLAREVASRSVTVNAIAPGFIDTDMTRALSEEQRRALLEQIPLNRLGTAEEIADVVAFLASPAAAYITGETINVNGGMYMA